MLVIIQSSRIHWLPSAAKSGRWEEDIYVSRLAVAIERLKKDTL
jgi:hypothetical protein